MIGPVTTIPVSVISGGGVGFATIGEGAGAAFVTVDTAGLLSPQAPISNAAPNVIPAIRLRILLLRPIPTTPANTTPSRIPTKTSAGKTRTPRDTIPREPFLVLPSPRESRHPRSESPRARKTPGSHATFLLSDLRSIPLHEMSALDSCSA